MSKKVEPVVEVRAYDLGGFGDIAGALRVASHLERGGTPTVIRPVSGDADRKLDILRSDIPVVGRKTNAIQVDVAGHYRDGRIVHNPKETPHNFTEDMDNPQSRKPYVPIYIKSGMVGKGRQVPDRLGGAQNNPMFYRPFREWDLPKPSERDVRKQIMAAVNIGKNKGKKPGFWSKLFGGYSVLEETLNSTDKFSFCHFQPGIPAEYFFSHPYIRALETAALDLNSKNVIGLFLGKDQEGQIAEAAEKRGYKLFGSSGEYFPGMPNTPTLVFMGPQPQMTTTSLFLSATVPNLVTGDLSLSDAVYGLLAMDGPAFFYDCPGWKFPTFEEMCDIFGRYHPDLPHIFTVGSLSVIGQDEQSKKAIEQLKESVARLLAGEWKEQFRNDMRTAIGNEIAHRFGGFMYDRDGSANGLYVPRGSPFLIQDATENVIRRLLDDPVLMSEVEMDRMRLAGEWAPLVVVETDVMEEKDAVPGIDYNAHWLLDKYTIKIEKDDLFYSGLGGISKNYLKGDIDKHYSIGSPDYFDKPDKWKNNKIYSPSIISEKNILDTYDLTYMKGIYNGKNLSNFKEYTIF